jgi:hypothetical protein
MAIRLELAALLGTAAVAAVLCGIGCSSSDDGGAARDDDPTQANNGAQPPSATPAPPPTPPGSPLPPDLQLEGGAPPGPAPDPGFRTMWAVDDAGRLVRFTSAEPGKVTTLPLTGLATGERLLAIDFRPSDGKMYGLGSTSRLYVIDKTGAAKAIGAAKAFALEGTAFGFDVNPVVDKIRVHSDTDQNLRLDPTMGTATKDAPLAFALKDPNEGQSPNLVATAYTNSVSPAPTATMLYSIDSTRNLLTRLAAPNDGKVTTVGSLGVDVTEVAGFDIWGGASGATGSATKPLTAYATLMVSEKTTGLYTIDLATGAAKLVAAVGHPTRIHGLAIEP